MRKSDLFMGFGSLVLFLVWGLFALMSSKSPLDYFFQNSVPIEVGEVIEPSSQKVLFRGFTADEGGFRWSGGYSQYLCVKIPLGLAIDVAHLRIKILVLDDLIQEPIEIIMNHVSREYRCAHNQCTFDMVLKEFEVDNEKLCAVITIPKVVNVSGDPRDLGYQFLGLVLEKETSM